MYESKPTEREGERIDTIVTEAITATASTGGAGANRRRAGAKGPGAEQYKKALKIISGVAAAEAGVIMLMVVF